MALVMQKNRTSRTATPKQLISNKENFFIFRLKGLIGNVHQAAFYFPSKGDENLKKMYENILSAEQHLQAAELYFKEYQKQRIKEGEKK